MMTTSAPQRWDQYYTPESVEEAVDLLQHYDGEARVVGGGTDLLVETRRGLHRPVKAMVDVTQIEGLDTISADGDYVVIGCGVTHSQIINDPFIRAHGTCLAESCGVIGGPQVRNVGTLAGKACATLPAGDGTIGLLALGGEIEVASAKGTRWMPLQESFKGPGKSFIDRYREVLTRLRFRPTGVREGSAHDRVMRPQGLCLPIISMGVRIGLDDSGAIADARVSMGPVGPVPYLAEPVMEVLVGSPTNEDVYAAAAEVALSNVTLRASKYRASREYREQMLRTFLPALVARAVDRARDTVA